MIESQVTPSRAEPDPARILSHMINQLILIWVYFSLQKTAKPESGITHEATDCSIENFEFIAFTTSLPRRCSQEERVTSLRTSAWEASSERVQINPDNSRAMSALTFLSFKLNTLQTNNVKL